ncbi:phosphotransferase [Streptomyces griseus]|uniref:phosphotransferase n=1 Tax=Streptomyces griseus TaxID=1911 RepID=UPI0004C846EC|nr:phosphotransferase [Streptomyces griseus]
MLNRLPFDEALRSTVGIPKRSTLLDSSPRSRVWRVQLADRSLVIVKQITDSGDTAADADTRFAREIAGLRLAGRAVGPAVAPAVLATDPSSRVMVLEHVDDLGRTDDWMPGYAEALARLHALTHALLHGDPCPGNDLRTSDGVRFVDFERASLGNGLVELAYFRIGFPTCWCAMSVTGAPLAEVEDIYRTTWRGLTGHDVPGDLADACAGWLIQGDALVERAHRGTVDQFARVPTEDFTWGRVSARERLVHRLGVVAGLTRDHDHLRAVGRLSSTLAARLSAGPPALRPLPAHDTRPWFQTDS